MLVSQVDYERAKRLDCQQQPYYNLVTTLLQQSFIFASSDKYMVMFNMGVVYNGCGQYEVPAPAVPPATNCLHHIPVFLSSSVNSSGMRMESIDSPMLLNCKNNHTKDAHTPPPPTHCHTSAVNMTRIHQRYALCPLRHHYTNTAQSRATRNLWIALS